MIHSVHLMLYRPQGILIPPPAVLDPLQLRFVPLSADLYIPQVYRFPNSWIFTRFLEVFYINLMDYTSCLGDTMDIRRRYCSCSTHEQVSWISNTPKEKIV
jgi:hypothetical protein